MMIAALGTLLIGLLPQNGVLSMIGVIVASLTLALGFGVQAVRQSDPTRHIGSARLGAETARRR
jgi:hypothetical protein